MTFLGAVPRRCVNLPPGSLRTLWRCMRRREVRDGGDVAAFGSEMQRWLGVPHVLGASTGRAAFQLALQALALPRGAEIVFPAFTFPVMPMVAQLLGYRPVFCAVDPETFNAGPEQVEPVLTAHTGAVLATHLFGRPCAIGELAELTRARGIRLLEDCAHACGVRVAGRQVGTFGDVGVFSFAQGKNMPCFGGGAIATGDDAIAARARELLSSAALPPARALVAEALSVWAKWLVTRPAVFSLTAYRALRLRMLLGKPLMDSAVGDELLAAFRGSQPRVQRLANVQAALGRLQLLHIDAFNRGARRNGEVLTAELGEVPGVRVPPAGGDHIYVYYPLSVDPARRDDLRRWLLRHGIDTKTSDMADCSTLAAFGGGGATGPVTEASVLEICVYPSLSEAQMRRIAHAVRRWASRSTALDRAAPASPSRRATA